MAPIRCCFDQTAVWHSDAARGPSTPSFDYLVGAGEQGRRNFEAESLCSLKVDDQLEFRWLLDWQIGWPGAFENLVHKSSGASVGVEERRPVAHEAPCLGILVMPVNGWQPMLCGEVREPRAVKSSEGIREHN